ncbi:MAG: ABC transporter permease [Patescibacteria group bacterium]|nr:ABC transporter permease [Patescibacteria group bacterium]MDD5715763.1 ABC transporter permease [Patescibacteria group bacterium]
MRFLDYFRSAFKNLVRHKVRTFLTIVAITIGSLSIILMVSLLVTIRQSVQDFFASMDAFTLVTVTPDPNAADSGSGLIRGDTGGSDESGKILDDTTVATLKALPHVADATPIGSGLWIKNMKLEGQDKKMWANLISYDPETKVFNMPLAAGRNLTGEDMDKIIVSTEFAKTYGSSGNPENLLGKNVVLMFQGGDIPDWGGLTPEKPLEGDDKAYWEEQQKKIIEINAEIVGVAKSSTFDSSQNYINIAWARKLMTHVRWEWQSSCSQEEQQAMKDKTYRGPEKDCSGTQVLVKNDDSAKNGYGSIILKTDDTSNIKGVSDAISKLGYGVSTAQDMLDETNNMLMAIGAVFGAIGGISLFVAAIGIINTMVMAGYERIREIGVMRACGATRKTIRRLFTFEAALLGFIGGVFGLALSYGIGKAANIIADKYASSIDLPFDKVASFPWWLIVGVLAFTTVIGLLSGLGPAVRSSRLNPVDALRYE